jgi:hypothetical protein
MSADPPFDWDAYRDECKESRKDTPGLVATDLRELIALVERCAGAHDVNTPVADEARAAADQIRLKLSDLSLGCRLSKLKFPNELVELLEYLSCSNTNMFRDIVFSPAYLKDLRSLEDNLLRDLGPPSPEPKPADVTIRCSQKELLEAFGTVKSNKKYLEMLIITNRLRWVRLEDHVGFHRYEATFADPAEGARIVAAIERKRASQSR